MPYNRLKGNLFRRFFVGVAIANFAKFDDRNRGKSYNLLVRTALFAAFFFLNLSI